MYQRLILTGLKQLELDHTDPATPVSPGMVELRVLYCAVCRTDAKMWQQGHRDLSLPRVPGHELVARDEDSGKLYTIWPGQACGKCHYCGIGRENLCDQMKIIGFHSDGGFAEKIRVPAPCLVELPHKQVPTHLYCFTEPLACVYNAFLAAPLQSGQKVVIYGGGVLGMTAAIVSKEMGAIPLVIEQSQEKIGKAHLLLEHLGITACKDTTKGNFDLAINCCDSPIAFAQCVGKLGKGGTLCYFSGLKKNEELDTNLLNLIHYKELQVIGSYGPNKDHMKKAVALCCKIAQELELLVEQCISPQLAPSVMEEVLSARPFKYIIDFTDQGNLPSAPTIVPSLQKTAKQTKAYLSKDLQKICDRVTPVPASFRASAQKKIDLKTKPLGALGTIETLAIAISSQQQTLHPKIINKSLLVFAGDHGVVEEGVSAFPAKVTLQMVENFLKGGAAINVFCNQYNIDLQIVDMGVKGDLSPHPLLINKKIDRGTRNFTLEPAMTENLALQAIRSGCEVFLDLRKGQKYQLVGLGEMGIGNTSAAAAIISCVTGIPVAEICGRGTGVDDKGLERKIEVLEKALHFHQPDPQNGLAVLMAVGGFEIAGICGAVLAAASQKTCIVLDGVISTAAGLIAWLLCPQVTDYIISGHKSVEIGQRAALQCMGLQPVLDLDMRLGEGTGAAITMNLVELAAKTMCEMASFEEAGISRSTKPQVQ